MEKDSLRRIYALCYYQQQHPWKCQSLRRYAVYYCQLQCEEDMLCVTASLMKKICCVLLPVSWRRYAVCYCQSHEEDMLCVTASLMKKICCVLLPVSWRRYAVCYCQSHCKENIAVYFYKCVYQKECLQCQVPSREGMCEWYMLAIKIFFKT